MPRYIIIDHDTGYIWGDSADLAGESFSGTPLEYAKALDGNDDTVEYEEHGPGYRATSGDYRVYRADIDGSEAVPVVWDGQDQETIDEVERLCRLEAIVTRTIG